MNEHVCSGRDFTNLEKIIVFGLSTWLLFLCIGSLEGATLKVPQEYSTIQSAIDAAGWGDIVQVSDGIYSPSTNGEVFPIQLKSGVSLYGANADVSILDAENTNRVIECGSSSTIKGFTITNGNTPEHGGGIFCFASDVNIIENIIINNTAASTGLPRNGGGIYCSGSGKITRNVISNNQAQEGGGITCYGNAPDIVGNLINNNNSWAGGGIYVHTAWEQKYYTVKIYNNIIVDNAASYGGGIKVTGADWASVYPQIINNTIRKNGNHGIYNTYADPTLINNIITENMGYGIYSYVGSYTDRGVTVTYSDVWNNTLGDYYGCPPGVGCISSDPLFVGGTPFNYHLQPNSPCIDAGDTAPEYNDPDGSRNDMGCYGGPWADITAPLLVSANTRITTTIEVTFSKDIDEITIDSTDFSVTNNDTSYTVQNALESSAGIVTITLTLAMPTDATPLITITGDSLSDLAGNYCLIGSSVQAVDGVPPIIISVTVTPDPVESPPSEYIAGDIAFKIVFSETMDTSITPLVRYDPAGVISWQDCRTNSSWATTNKTNDTYIVYNDNTIDKTTGDGTATIDISLAQDIAGNVMTTGTSHGFIININVLTLTNVKATPSIFNPACGEKTTISYVLSEPAEDVDVTISDGVTVIKNLVANQSQTQGQHKVIWDGTNNLGQPVPSQAYSCEISAQNISPAENDLETITITVDNTKPVISNVSDTPDPLAINGTSTITFDTSAPGDNITLNQKYVIFNSAGDLADESGWESSTEGPGQQFTWDSTGFAEGLYQYEIRAKIPPPTNISANSQTGTIVIRGQNSQTATSADSNVEIWHQPTFTINIEQVEVPQDAARAITTEDPSIYLESPVYNITVTEGTFESPIILIFNYDPSLDGNGLEIRRYDAGTQTWTTNDVYQYVDFANNRIIAEIYSLSLVGIFTKKPVIKTTVNFDPDTLNLKSKGNWVTCYIELPENYNPEDIDNTTIRITKINNERINPIFTEQRPISIGDHDENGIDDLMVKFKRELLQNVVSIGKAKITVEGELKDDKSFEGSGTIRVILPDAMNTVGLKGGEITNTAGARILVSENALENETTIALGPELITTLAEETKKQLDIKRKDLGPIGTGYEFEPEGIQFKKPVTIEIPYNNKDIEGIDEQYLRIYYWNPKKNSWEVVETSKVLPEENKVTAELTHFSLYKIMVKLKTEEEVASADGTGTENNTTEVINTDPTFREGEIYVFPNPAKGGKHPTIHVECGIADRVEIRLYNIAAELVGSIDISGSDWKILDNKYCYEYTWDVSDVASGVYVYLVRAKKGDREIKTLKKGAIIK
ncbi:MAG: FlgD immunoglobulin-like domain containing protein [Elusimicrobiota bacterium]